LPCRGKALQELYRYHHARVPDSPKPMPGAAPPVAELPQAPRAGDVHEILDIPPRPFAVPIPMPAPAVLTGWQRTVLYGDTHVPHHCDKTLGVVQRIILEAEADRVVHIGDLLDCYDISKYSKDPNRLHGLQDEIDLARVHLHQIAQLAPAAERWLLEGNHEDRLRKTIWDLPGASSALPRLGAFQEAMTWPHLLGLADIGWHWVPTHLQSRTSILPKLITKHGTLVRKWSSWTAKGEWEKYGKGGLSGHTHRMGAFYHRDHNGAHLWVETGCTCKLDPEYILDPDWQNGAVVVTHTKDGERYAVEQIYIQDGMGIYNGKEIRAT
jgi:hypothetical protein